MPTHRLGHVLDIFMFRPTDDIVCSTIVSHVLLPDIFCVVCDHSSIEPFFNQACNHDELLARMA